MKKITQTTFNFFASFGLSVTILTFMFLVILFGTLYQVDNGLYAAQQKYFDSIFVLHELGPITVPLPGAYILMVLIALNLVCGGFIRIRKSRYTAGVLITHFGIAFMLVSCALTFHFADRGNDGVPRRRGGIRRVAVGRNTVGFHQCRPSVTKISKFD